ncbi:MCE family protein [Rhodococcus rhodnii]|nr:MCE family protein [Rhodococcus rhodnii]TXG92283.1 MCE family protein [Rhodococcus rhodnii]
MSVGRRRMLGVAFFVVIGLFVATCVAIYDRTFVDVVAVRLVTDSAGNALPQQADVKLRGVTVGRVARTAADGDAVTVDLDLDPAHAARIPANVTARLLPKTLFGERYVALVDPDLPYGMLGDGAVVRQDSSGDAVEITAVLDDLLPLLQAVPPDDLSATLGALAQGLSGRGTELGHTLDRLTETVSALGAELPNIEAATHGLGDFAETYSDSVPDLVSALDNLRSVGSTLVEKRTTLDALWRTGHLAATDTADLLTANADSVIAFAADSREALQILGRYSPEFGCVLAGFARTAPEAREIMGADDPYPGIRATVQLTNPRGRYLPNQDEPRMLDDRGPNCREDYRDAGEPFPQYPGTPHNDGSYAPPSRNPGSAAMTILPAPEGVPDVVPGYAGSAAERATLTAIYSEATGLDADAVPGWTAGVGAAAFRGATVEVR